MIRFRVLGTVSLRSEPQGSELQSILVQPKRVGFLAYLALTEPGAFRTRDELLGLFWGDKTEEHARHSLSQMLYMLKRSLGPDVVETRGDADIRLAPGRLSCDAADFKEKTESGETGDALQLYGGELLPGFYLDRNRVFEQWLEAERRKLRQAATEAALQVSADAEAAGNGSEAVRWARQALEWSPYDESAIRRLIEALDSLGERGTALREVENFAARLSADLNVEPSSATQALAVRISEEHRALAPDDSPKPSLAQRSDDSADGPSLPSRNMRRLVAAVGLVVALAVVGALSLDWLRWPGSSAAAAELDPSRVLVTAFQNESGDPEVDELGRMATDWITRGLVQTGRVKVAEIGGVPELSRRAGLLRQESDRNATPGDLARDAGFGTLVVGSFFVRQDSAVFSAQIVDVRDDLVAWSFTSASSAQDPIPAVDELKEQIVGGVASMLDPALAEWAEHALQPPTYEAYLEFIDGLAAWRFEGELERALEHFEEAMAHDSGFVQPQLYAVALLSCPTCPYSVARADSLAQRIYAAREKLGPFDRTVLDALRAWLRGETLTALEQWRRVLDTAPNTEWQTTAGMVALAANRPAEAIDILSKVDPEAGWLSSWPSYWRYVTEAHHLLGKHEAELDAARRGKARHPGSNWMLWHEARALAALGELEELRTFVDTDLLRAEGIGPNPGWIIDDIGHELRAHGHAGVNQFSEEASQWFLDRQEDTRRWRVLYVQFLYGAERWEEATPLLEELYDEQPDFWPMRALVGLAAAKTGNTATAFRVLDELQALDPPYAYGWDEAWRAGILAALGDLEGSVTEWRRAVEEGFRQWPALHNQCVELCDYPPFQELVRPKG